jgi:hypothetical protein
MTSGAAIRESSGKIQICCQVSGSIAQPRALPFRLRKLALKELAASADRPKGVTIDEKQRRLWQHQTAMPRTRHEGTDFLGQRFTDAFMGDIGLLGAIKQLRRRDGRPEQHDSNEANEKTSHGGFSFLSNKIPSADIADESAPYLMTPTYELPPPMKGGGQLRCGHAEFPPELRSRAPFCFEYCSR